MGKRKLGESDSEDMDDDDDDSEGEGEENDKSDVTDNGNHSDSSTEADQSSGSVTEVKHDVASFGEVPSNSGSEEEKDSGAEEYKKSDESSHEPGLGVSEEKLPSREEADKFCLEMSVISGPTEEGVSKKSDSSDVVEREEQPAQTISSLVEEEASSVKVDGNSMSKSDIQDEVMINTSAEALNPEKPLNLEDFNSASELEVGIFFDCVAVYVLFLLSVQITLPFVFI